MAAEGRGLAARPSEEGLRLAARYSYITNSLGYCGPAGMKALFHGFVAEGKGKPADVRDALSRFEALYPYLQMIARRNGIPDPVDERVVRAYFTGNSLLKGGWRGELSALIRDVFSRRGLPRRVADDLASRVPARATPHHSFHVLFIHTITGRVPPTRDTENSCLISVGRVVDGEHVLRRFVEKDGRLGRPKLHRVAPIDGKFLGAPAKKGDLVALHWDYAAEKLAKGRAQALEKYTTRNLCAVFSGD